jgi:hypothetical protein
MQSQRHRTVIPGKLGPKEKIVSNFSFPTRMSGAATTKSHHAKQNGPDLAGGIGVEAGTCSLGKSEFRISTPVCIVTALMSPCVRELAGRAATAQAARGQLTTRAAPCPRLSDARAVNPYSCQV